MMEPAELEAMRTAWSAIRGRYQAYALVLPGDPSFICQPDICDAHCCRKFSVSVGEEDRARMERETGWAPIAFLECEDGEPIALPMVKPYLLRRAENRCGMLAADLTCGAYSGRPDACRQYPYQVLFPGRLRGLAREEAERMLASGTSEVALLVRHVECPGFSGPPIDEASWFALRESTFELQGGPVL
jgi:Fe-S-cluster containining protein